MDYANVYVGDLHPPQLTSPPPADQNWSNATSRTQTVSASDHGTGMVTFRLTGPGIDKTTQTSYGEPQNIQYTPAEGSYEYTLTAIDAVGNPSTPQTWTEKIDRTPPELGVSGGLFDAPSGFVKPSALDGQLAGSDDLSGLKTLALTNAAGTQLAGATSACTAAECPDDLVASVALTPAELPEGSSMLRLRAEDMVGNADTVEQSVKIDRTPPTAPAHVAASLRANSSDGVLAWSGSADPDLPTGEAGSGVAKYSYRWKQGGAGFTPWTETAEEKAAMPNVSLGAVIDVEVRAIDGADNQSALTIATVTTTDDPGQIDLQTTDDLPPDDSTAEARSAAVSSAQTPPRLLVRCRVGTSAELGSTNPFVAFVFAGEPGIQVRAPVDAHCAPNEAFGAEAEAAFQETTVTLTVCLKVYEHTSDGPSLRTLDCDTDKKRAPTFFRPLQVQAEELCRPGRVPYFTTFRFSAVSPGAPTAGGQPTGKSASVELDCNEAGAWRYRAANQPVAVPAEKLAANLKAAAADPNSPDRDPLPPHGAFSSKNRGWKPHHIIPAGMKHENASGEQAARAERLGYICDLHPNAAVNGVWLRGFKLRFDQPAYNTLDDPEETARQYHENLHTTVYFREVADMLYPYASPSGVCVNESGMRGALRGLRQRMIKGQMPR